MRKAKRKFQYFQVDKHGCFPETYCIKNKLYWTLDVAFREDYARNRKDHSAANLAVLRKITLNLIRLEPAEKYRTQKLSLNRKRLHASYNPVFLLNILLNL
jgi:hypothetical protein